MRFGAARLLQRATTRTLGVTVFAYLAIATACIVGFVLRMLDWRWWYAWGLSLLVVPLFILATVLFQVPGWEWWPVAILFGSLYGAGAGALGVLVAAAIRRQRDT